MVKKTKRPRSATRRTLPPDPTSLEAMIRSVDRQLRDRGTHLKIAFADSHARRGFRELFEQRAKAWQKLASLDYARALTLAASLRLFPANVSQEVAA